MEPIRTDLLPHISRFLEDPTKAPGFLVPSTYANAKLDALKAAGFAVKEIPFATSHHVFDAVYVPLKGGDRSALLDTALATIFGSSDRAAVDTMPGIMLAGVLRPLVVPKAVKVVIHDKRDPLETDKDVKLRRLALAEYDKALRTLARLSGLEVHFHAEGRTVHPPYPDKPGVVHIITNSQPPGQTSSRFVQLAFGLKIHEDGLSGFSCGPSKGRGLVLKDQLGEPLVQILGNTWYLLVPTLSHFNWQTSCLIFDQLLALAWKGGREAVNVKKPKPATRKTFVDATLAWAAEMPALIAADIVNVDRKIEEYQRLIAEYTRSKKESLAMLEAYGKSAFVKEIRGRLPKDFAAIKNDPNVKALTFTDDGFHVETAPLEIEHDGKRYAIGPFTIRVFKRGSVSVWSEAPTHLDGVPHPHIAKEGGPCFGNATRAITEAAGSQRYADAVRYVFRWLTEGYTHALAAVKIEEWPYVGEERECYEKRLFVTKTLAKAEAAAIAGGIRTAPITAIAKEVEEIMDGLTKSDGDEAGDEPAEEGVAHAAVS